MTHFVGLILLLAMILLLAKTFGYISLRWLRQPAVLGELFVGVLIGPSILHWIGPEGRLFRETLLLEEVHDLAELGVLLLMFVAGLELQFSEFARNARVSVFAGTLGVALPVGLGWGVGVIFGMSQAESLFLGLALGATSVSISAQTLIEMHRLRSRVGLGLLGAAVFDDVLVLLLLAAFTALGDSGGGWLSVLWIFVRMVLFLVGSVWLGWTLLPGLARRLAHLPVSQSMVALALVVAFLYGAAAEVFGGMAAITGTFLAGLLFGRTAEKESIQRGVGALAYGFFVPIFFVNIGLSLDLSAISGQVWGFILVVLLVAVVGKLLGAGLGGRLSGFSWLESAQLGTGMVSRGEVGLILATVGVSQGLINQMGYQAVVVMVFVTTLITPPILRLLFQTTLQQKEVLQ